MRKGIGGILVSLILITSIAAVTIPMAAGNGVFSISGYKYDVTDGTDKPLAEWTIKVTYFVSVWEIWTKTTTTDSNGFWKFTGLPPGDYRVTEELQLGWVQKWPLTGSYEFYLDGDYKPPAGGHIFKNTRMTAPGTGTPGYWKNHPEAWPVDTITIGGVPYTVTEAIAIMDMPDGDKTYTMFRALVAAKLNVLIGNDPSCIADTITEADAWMATYGPAGSGVHADDDAWQEGGEDLYETLDDYNNGLLCAPSRDVVESGTDTDTTESDYTAETTTQETVNGKSKKKPKK